MSNLKAMVKKEFDQLPAMSKIRLYRRFYRDKIPFLLGAWEWGRARLGMAEELSEDIFVDYSTHRGFYRADSVVDMLMRFDVVSFDLFDTVLFRKVNPTDVFQLVEQRLEIVGFAQQREQAEWMARQKKYHLTGSWEVSFSEIYEALPHFTDEQKQQLQDAELAMEREQLVANPVMKQVIKRLQAHGKRVIAISDMYLDAAILKEFLQGCEIPFPDRIYVSSEFGVSKSDGRLFERVRELERLQDKTIVHIGDNFHSDVCMGKNYGINSIHYLSKEKKL